VRANVTRSASVDDATSQGISRSADESADQCRAVRRSPLPFTGDPRAREDTGLPLGTTKPNPSRLCATVLGSSPKNTVAVDTYGIPPMVPPELRVRNELRRHVSLRGEDDALGTHDLAAGQLHSEAVFRPLERRHRGCRPHDAARKRSRERVDERSHAGAERQERARRLRGSRAAEPRVHVADRGARALFSPCSLPARELEGEKTTEQAAVTRFELHELRENVAWMLSFDTSPA